MAAGLLTSSSTRFRGCGWNTGGSAERDTGGLIPLAWAKLVADGLAASTPEAVERFVFELTVL
jgi:hypothetical protein